MLFYGLLYSVIVKLLQKDIKEFKESQTNESAKDSFTEKKKERMEQSETNPNAS